MLKGIYEKIKETTNNAIDLAQKMQSVTNEGFIINISIPKKLNNSTIEIHPAKRPFPLGKCEVIERTLRGHWAKEHTLCKFVKLSQIKQTGRVRLIINIYMGECWNPQQKDMEVVKGTRGRVLNPEMCNGASIMKSLRLEDKTQKPLQ